MSLFKVRYKGLSDIREIGKKHLADTHGIGVDGDLRWARPGDRNYGVHNVVFIENPSDELLAILKAEGTFTVAEVKDDESGPGEHEPIITGSVLDDTGSVVRDLTTGAESVVDPKANPAVPSGTEGGGTGTAGGTGGTTRGGGSTRGGRAGTR